MFELHVLCRIESCRHETRIVIDPDHTFQISHAKCEKCHTPLAIDLNTLVSLMASRHTRS